MGVRFLSFIVNELPLRPWPLTIGGLPITISDNKYGRGPMFPRAIFGSSTVSLHSDRDERFKDLSDAELRLRLVEISEYFSDNFPEIRLVEIICTSEKSFYVVAEDDVDAYLRRRQLPGKIAMCIIYYIRKRDIHRPEWVECPLHVGTEPLTRTTDSKLDVTLRPGMMIQSKPFRNPMHPSVYSSTSGVSIEKRADRSRYMTVSSHLVGDDGTVYDCLSSIQNRFLGRAVSDIPFTDICMVQLEEDVQVANETGDGVKLTRLIGGTPDDTLKFLSSAYFNEPLSGQVEGLILAKSIKLERLGDGLRHVAYNWTYMGQEEGRKDDPPESPDDIACGGAVWDGSGLVVGFHHYHIRTGKWAGFSVSVSAREVAEAGYRLW